MILIWKIYDKDCKVFHYTENMKKCSFSLRTKGISIKKDVHSIYIISCKEYTKVFAIDINNPYTFSRRTNLF